MKETGGSLDPGTRVPSSYTPIAQQNTTTRPGTDYTPPISSASPKDPTETTAIPNPGNSMEPEHHHYHGQPDPRNHRHHHQHHHNHHNHHRHTTSNSSSASSQSRATRPSLIHDDASLSTTIATTISSTSTLLLIPTDVSTMSTSTSHIDHATSSSSLLQTTEAIPHSQLALNTSLSQTFHQPTSNHSTCSINNNPPISASIQTTAATPSVEVVMKSAELESPNTMLRHRRSTRSTHSTHSTSHASTTTTTRSPADSLRHFPTTEETDTESTGDGTIAPPSLQRKPSFSSTREHVPSGIKTEQLASSFKMRVDEASPVSFLDDKGVLADGQETGRSDKDDINSNIDNKDDDDFFDWEEDKIYEVQQDKEAQSSTDKSRMLQDDVCCRPLHCRLHPWILKLIKHTFLLILLLLPKFILHHVHSRHHETIVLIEDGRPYMAVVVGNHIGYFVICDAAPDHGSLQDYPQFWIRQGQDHPGDARRISPSYRTVLLALFSDWILGGLCTQPNMYEGQESSGFGRHASGWSRYALPSMDLLVGLSVSLGDPGHEHALHHEAIHHADSLGSVRAGQLQVCRAQFSGTCSGRASEDQATESDPSVESACTSLPPESVPSYSPLGREVDVLVGQHLSGSAIARW